MAIPSNVQAALTRLTAYNNGNYDAATNPLGFSKAGHRVNLFVLTADMTLVSNWLEGRVVIGETAASQAVASAAQAALDRADALLSRTQSASSASSALASSTAAVAASQASGNVVFFNTKAQANAAVSGLGANQVVDIFFDESQGGATTRYRVESGALVYKTTSLPAMTAFARTILDDADAASVLATLGALVPTKASATLTGIGAQAGTFGSVSGSGRYIKLDELVVFKGQIVDAAHGTAAGFVFANLPIASGGLFSYGDGRNLQSGKQLQVQTAGGLVYFRDYNDASPVANGQTIDFTIAYLTA